MSKLSIVRTLELTNFRLASCVQWAQFITHHTDSRVSKRKQVKTGNLQVTISGLTTEQGELACSTLRKAFLYPIDGGIYAVTSAVSKTKASGLSIKMIFALVKDELKLPGQDKIELATKFLDDEFLLSDFDELTNS